MKIPNFIANGNSLHIIIFLLLNIKYSKFYLATSSCKPRPLFYILPKNLKLSLIAEVAAFRRRDEETKKKLKIDEKKSFFLLYSYKAMTAIKNMKNVPN